MPTPPAGLAGTLPADAMRVRRVLRPAGAAPDALAAVVAIPARDEERAIGGCLAALAAQRGRRGRPLPPGSVEVLLLLNNCTDGTFDAAVAAAARLGLRLSVVDVELKGPAAHVGWARRLAMDSAAGVLLDAGRPGGAVLSTDADSAATPTWVASTLRALEGGADAVAGVIVPRREEMGGLNAPCRRRLRLEHAYGGLLDRIASIVDPEPHDPWPRHPFHCGASMAATLPAYLAAGGLPPEPVAEDRAFFAEVRRRDGRIRHCPDVRVVTSCRVDGRASGGMADTLVRWSGGSAPEAPDARGDSVDSVAGVLRALRLRAALRRAYRGDARPHPALASRLGVGAETLDEFLRRPTFGLAYEAAATASPTLDPGRAPAERLGREVAAARRLLSRLGVPARQRRRQAARSLALSSR